MKCIHSGIAILMLTSIMFFVAACSKTGISVDYRLFTDNDYELSRFAINVQDESVKNKVMKAVETLGFTGSVLVARNFDILYAGGFGYCDGKDGEKNTANSVYAIASLSKQFTAAAILKLVEEGKISLADAVWEYFPEWPEDMPVTVDQLLHMESGLESDFWNIAYREYGYTCMSQADEFQLSPHKPEECFSLIYSDKLHFIPGTKYQYSNINYWLLSKIVEEASGLPFHNYIEQNFFDECSMKTAGMNFPLDMVPGHYGGERTAENADLYEGCGTVSAGVYDLFEWVRRLHRGEVLGSSAYRVMISQKNGPYACGLINDGNMIWHNGRLNGYNSYMGYNVESGLLLIVLSNSRTYEFRGRLCDFPAEELAELLLPQID